MQVRRKLSNPIRRLALTLGSTSALLILPAPSSWGQIAASEKTPSPILHFDGLADGVPLPQTVAENHPFPQQPRAVLNMTSGVNEVKYLPYQRQPEGLAVRTEGTEGVDPKEPNYPEQPPEESGGSSGPRGFVLPIPKYSSLKGIYSTLDFGLSDLGSNNQSLNLRLEGGQRTLGFNLRYVDPPGKANPLDSGYTLRAFNTRSPSGIFLNGDREVNLIHDHTPWVHRLGVGAEFLKPVSLTGLTLSAGVNYQRVSVRNAAWTPKVFSRDELGNPVTFSNEGEDDLLTFSLSAFQDGLNDPEWPTSGSRFRVSTEQSVPVGKGEILFNRLSASYTQFLPLTTSQTFVFNLQGGTVIGDLPAYEAFGLGGANSVRGYKDEALAAARSFVLAAAEYRFPIIEDLNLPYLSRLGGTVFFDYASDLGTGEDVRGKPADVRGKPGNGFGFGVGLRVLTDFGPVRLEFGVTDEGNARAQFSLGERF